MIPTKKLRELAMAATQEWSSCVWIETDGNEWRATGPGHESEAHDHGSEPGCPDEQAAQRDADYIACCSPSTVLGLLEQLEAKDREIERQTLRADQNWDGQEDADKELAAKEQECDRLRESIRLVRIEMHKENIEEATVMLDALAASVGLL